MLEALERVTVWARSPPSVTLAAVTLLMVGAASLSMMVPVPTTPPMVRLRFSVASLVLSLTVGTLTVKLVTPAGTLIWPVPLL